MKGREGGKDTCTCTGRREDGEEEGREGGMWKGREGGREGQEAGKERRKGEMEKRWKVGGREEKGQKES